MTMTKACFFVISFTGTQNKQPHERQTKLKAVFTEMACLSYLSTHFLTGGGGKVQLFGLSIVTEVEEQ